MTNRNEVTDELVRELPDMRAALRACVLYSGQPLKAVAFNLGIEASHLSKMLNRNPDPRHFPPEKIHDLMTICGNEIPLRWLLLKCGHPSPRSVGDLEATVARLKAENAELRGETRVLVNIFKTMEVGDDD